MLICCLKLNSVFCFFTVYGQSTHSLPLNVLRHCHCLSLFEDLLFLDQLFFFSLKADQKLFICLCIWQHHCCADFLFMSACEHAHLYVCFTHLPAHARLFLCVTTGFNHLWSEATGWSQWWPTHAHPVVCVCVYLCIFVGVYMLLSSLCCSPAQLLMTQQSTLMTRNTYSLLFCEPQLISWSVKHWK